jgi:hypothetical protein
MTLTTALARLTAFRQQDGGDLLTSRETLTVGAATLTALSVHYEGSGVPREALLVFNGTCDHLLWMTVYSPTRFAHALEEGLTFEQAEQASQCRVESIDDLIRYLKGETFNPA